MINQNKEVFSLGDFNIDLMHYNEFLNSLASLTLTSHTLSNLVSTQVIQEPLLTIYFQ